MGDLDLYRVAIFRGVDGVLVDSETYSQTTNFKLTHYLAFLFS
jgi:hypothetical protein